MTQNDRTQTNPNISSRFNTHQQRQQYWVDHPEECKRILGEEVYEQLVVAQKVMEKYRDALDELSKQ